MNYSVWLETVPEAITVDSLWKMKAYRLALFLADIGWHDVTKLSQDKRTVGLSDQLYRALGAISANLAEGYSRSTGKDQARFYAYALGSARESRGWYFKARHVLGPAVVEHRLQLFSEVIPLLLTMIPQQRSDSRALREEDAVYLVNHNENSVEHVINQEKLERLLQDIPLPEE